jgi:hypothetical protein
METKFTQFLRAGGNGEFLIRRRADAWVRVRTAFSIKSEFPNYAALRDNFAARLDAVIQSNTAMLLQAISAQYDPPLTAAELPGVSAARADTLALWEERIEVIWTEWHSHLQRLRPIREAMEQHLLRRFAGLINELRQRGLGIRQYVWRSRDDGKVRSAADFRRANIEAGHPEWGSRAPQGWTWHHVEDARTMQLVPSIINGTFNHRGGASVARNP